jgi:hypothetical protein
MMANEIRSFDFFIERAGRALIEMTNERLGTSGLDGCGTFYRSNYRGDDAYNPYVLNRIGYVFASAIQFINWVFYGSAGTARWYPSQEDVSWSLFGCDWINISHTELLHSYETSIGEDIVQYSTVYERVADLTLPIFGSIEVSLHRIEGIKQFPKKRERALSEAFNRPYNYDSFDIWVMRGSVEGYSRGV